MSKHTPGPWTVQGIHADECALGDGQYVQTEDGRPVAYASQSKEDAHLISAAPDLLEALKAEVRECGHRGENPLDCKRRVCSMSQAAIAKAESIS